MSKGRNVPPRQPQKTVEEPATAYMRQHPGLYILQYGHAPHCPVGVSTQDATQCVCDPDVSLVSAKSGKAVMQWPGAAETGRN